MNIIFGAGAFNNQYDEGEAVGDMSSVLQHAFDNGVNTIDTSAGYGPSEEIIGRALQKLGTDRSKVKICTKCCRWEGPRFEFSRDSVIRSVERSLKRLQISYIDTLFIHDVEYGSPDDVLEALATAFEFKDKGIVREVGISGYPLDVLLATVKLSKSRLMRPLDIVFSYCNLTLQNNLLLKYRPLLLNSGAKRIQNGSPLSMSLLRSGSTHAFHNAQPQLRERAQQIAQKLLEEGIELADVATQFSYNRWDGQTVIGIRSVAELDAAIKNSKTGRNSPTEDLWTQIEGDFGEWHNAVWEEEGPKQYQPLWLAVNKEFS